MEEKKEEKQSWKGRQEVRERGGVKRKGGDERAMRCRADFSPQSSGAIHCIFMTLPESE